MIRVRKDYQDVPKGLTGKKAEGLRAQAMVEKGQHKFDGTCYGHATVRQSLAKIYHGKCAYCETPLEPGFSGRVEHYRPKAKVTEDAGHPGYYWLGYEWSNLLWSCERCNGKKLNHFPVAGPRVSNPSADRANCQADASGLMAEKPQLLNPELDDPAVHLSFLPDGGIKAKSDEGSATIRWCALDRELLCLARKKKVDDMHHALLRQLEALIQLRADIGADATRLEQEMRLAFLGLFQNLEQAGKPEDAYSRLGWHMVQEFETFYLERVPGTESRRLLAAAWKLFHTRWQKS